MGHSAQLTVGCHILPPDLANLPVGNILLIDKFPPGTQIILKGNYHWHGTKGLRAIIRNWVVMFETRLYVEIDYAGGGHTRTSVELFLREWEIYRPSLLERFDAVEQTLSED